MKTFFTKFKYSILGGMIVIAGTVYAAQISVPSAPSAGYLLQSLSTGNYNPVSLIAGSNITIATTTSSITINGTGGGSAFPFTPQTYGVSTSTTVGFLNGLFSTASSTFVSNTYFPSLSQGVAYIGSSGKLNSVASSSLNVGTASALAANGTNCSAGNYPLGVDASGNVENCTAASVGLSSYDAWTHPAAGISATTSQVTVAGLLSTASSTFVSTVNFNNQATIANNTNLEFGGGSGNPTDFKTGTDGTALFQTGTNQNFKVRVGSDTSSNFFAVTNNAFNTNLFSVTGAGLVTFGYSSSTIYSSFNTSSTTNLILSSAVNIGPGCASFGSSGQLQDSGTLCGTVSSVGLSDVSSSLTIGSTPITSAGTITAALNLAHTNTWSVLQNFNYSSSTVYSTFQTSSTTVGFFGTLNIPNLGIPAGSFLAVDPTGKVIATTTPAGGGLSSYDAWTHSTIFTPNSATTTKISIGTTTPYYSFTVASSTGPQIALSDGTSGVSQWTMRNAGGNLYFATTTVSGTATTSTAALTLNGSGVPGISLSSSTPFATLAVNPLPGNFSNQFVVGSSTGTSFIVNNAGNVGVGTTSPWRNLAVTGTVGFDGLTGSSGLQVGILCLSANKEVINESVACVASAKRFKQNITPLTVGLDELLKLKPVAFNWKPEYNGALQSDPNFSGVQYSLIADEVQKVDAHLVSVETASTTFDGVSYPAGTVHGLADTNHWVALFVSSIQNMYYKFQTSITDLISWNNDQDKSLKVLEDQNAAQQKQIDALQMQINNLKK